MGKQLIFIQKKIVVSPLPGSDGDFEEITISYSGKDPEKVAQKILGVEQILTKKG